MAAGGVKAANWAQLGEIAASWVISPVLGGLIAAVFLDWIKHSIVFRDDMVGAARRAVPVLIGLMTWAFSSYLMLKGLSRVWKVDFPPALAIGAGLGLAAWGLVRQWVQVRATMLPNTREGINSLFTLPLICGAALLSFAHGANDVANAVGPLAAIAEAVRTGAVSGQASIPLWVMIVGAAGISLGLLLYGPKLIRKVGSEITELDQIRAFCIAMSAALTVIVASQLGLPVSSTHIAVGAVFGVGFLREYLQRRQAHALEFIRSQHGDAPDGVLERYLEEFSRASVEKKRDMLAQLKRRGLGDHRARLGAAGSHAVFHDFRDGQRLSQTVAGNLGRKNGTMAGHPHHMEPAEMIRLSFLLAWVAAAAFAVPVAAQTMVSINRPEVNLRAGAGTQHEALWVVRHGYPLQVTGRQGSWLKVRDFENDEAWVYQALTSRTPHHVVKVGTVNIRSAPSTRSRIVGQAGYGEVLRTLEKRPSWVRVRQEDGGVTGWVARHLLWGW